MTQEISEIPFVGTDKAIFDIKLGKVNCRITLWYQDHDESWYLSLSAPKGTPIVKGRRLSSGSFVIGETKSVLKGDLLVSDGDLNASDPVKNSFEKGTHAIYWVPFG